MDKKLAALCRQCDYGSLTQFLSENKKSLSETAHHSENILEEGIAYARQKISDFGASPDILTAQWDNFFWNCHGCKLLQVRKAILELEAEAREKEAENPLFYWGVASVVATAKQAAQNKERN
jgi:hypothetical protein